MERVTPDKVRFCDTGAVGNPAPVHTLELSDERSVRQFVTLWFKCTHRGEAWAEKAGNDRQHSPATYHREDEHTGAFVARRWPGKEKQDWRIHYHIDLDHPPTVADIEPLSDVLPDSVRGAAIEYLKGREAWPVQQCPSLTTTEQTEPDIEPESARSSWIGPATTPPEPSAEPPARSSEN